MDTAEISYRVADFLKRHPPFNAIDDANLLALASRGRVRFHEPFEYILWQGEPHRHQVFVIQQGTVSLWDESRGHAELRDVRGPGDLLGVDRYHDAPATLHSARSESDVVIYAFPADGFDQHVLSSPHAAHYVAAEGRPGTDYQPSPLPREPHRTFLHMLAGHRSLTTCQTTDDVAAVAGHLLSSRSGAAAALDADRQLRGIVTAETVLRWVAAGGGDARRQLVGSLLAEAPVVVPPDATVADGAMAVADAGAGALAITADGTTASPVQSLVSLSDLAAIFGDDPAAVLRDVRLAATVAELRELTTRSRVLTLEHLASASAVDWLARFAQAVDGAILRRLLELLEISVENDCWCFAGSAGRQESLTLLAPHVVVLLGPRTDRRHGQEQYLRVMTALSECGYLPRSLPFETHFYVAPASEWNDRCRRWVKDPVIEQVYRARTLFDLRPVTGAETLWAELAQSVTGAVDHEFLHVLANDCLASLPPLTFYEDAVVDSQGDYLATFKLEESAVRPLVDVGRVFGLAGGCALGRSTLDRFATARTLLPEHEEIFRDAAATFRVVLWQQGRVGITQGTSGAELPPALLSRHDRHVLKGGFRSILRLLQFTAGREWFDRL